MERSPDNDAARRVVEEPRGSALPYFAVAIVAAVIVWGVVLPAIPDLANTPDPHASSGARMDAGPHSARGDVRRLFSADDYPAEAQINGQEGTVQAQLAIDSNGRVRSCTIVLSSGARSLDDTTCLVLKRRARFSPARDVDGHQVPDTIITPR